MTNKEVYRQYCKEQDDLPLFIKDWWLDVVCENWDVAIVRNGDNISGVWPYRVEQKLNVTLLRDPALTPYWGPHVIYPHDLKLSKRDNFEHETITALLEQMPDVKVWHISAFPGLKQVGLFKDAGFDVQVRQTFIMPLEDDMDTIFSKLKEDYRRNVRRAGKELTISNEPEMLQELWQYQKATLDNKDVRIIFSGRQLQQLYDACAAHDCAALWVARKGSEVQAIVWHAWDASRAYYLVGSKNPSSADSRAMTALLWKAIEESKKAGKSSFDFEGSVDPGVERFFRNFGGNRELYLVLKKNESTLWKLKEKIR